MRCGPPSRVRRRWLTERYVRVRYTPLLDVKIRDDLTMHILVDPNLPLRGRDQETGYPCFA